MYKFDLRMFIFYTLNVFPSVMRVRVRPGRGFSVGPGGELRRRDPRGADRGGVLGGHLHAQHQRRQAVRQAEGAAPRRDIQWSDVQH